MNTSDESKLFQTDAQLAHKEARARKAVLTKTIGRPIQLPSRAIKLKVRGQDAWVAESGWVVRRICLHTGKTKRVYKGHQGPCTSLDFFQASTPDGVKDLMVTGSWDKTIKVWDVESGDLLSTATGHIDFIKSLLVIPHLQLLVSGSSDKTISLWSLSSAHVPSTPLTRLHVLKSHTRPVDSFVLFKPVRSDHASFFSGDSMGVIRRWEVGRRDGGDMVEILYHPLSESVASSSTTTDLKPALTIPHPLYPETTAIRSILLLPTTFHPQPLLLAGSSDEDIRAYDISTTLETASRSYTAQQIKSGPTGRSKEVSRVQGHWADVIDLDVWVKDVEGGKKEAWVVSASLDETLRRWSMADILNPPPIPKDEVKEQTKEGMMTEDEERELAELMGSDIEDDV